MTTFFKILLKNLFFSVLTVLIFGLILFLMCVIAVLLGNLFLNYLNLDRGVLYVLSFFLEAWLIFTALYSFEQYKLNKKCFCGKCK